MGKWAQKISHHAILLSNIALKALWYWCVAMWIIDDLIPSDILGAKGVYQGNSLPVTLILTKKIRSLSFKGKCIWRIYSVEVFYIINHFGRPWHIINFLFVIDHFQGRGPKWYVHQASGCGIKTSPYDHAAVADLNSRKER